MIATLVKDYPVSIVCEVVDFPRSSYYYNVKGRDDTALIVAIREVAGQWPRYGYRRVTKQVRRQKKQTINSKRVRRVMKELGVRGKNCLKKRRTTNSEHAFPRFPNLVQELAVVRPDHVWCSDITYVKLLTQFVYLAVIMDVFTRCI